MRRQTKATNLTAKIQWLLAGALFLAGHQLAQAQATPVPVTTNPEPRVFGFTAARRILISIPDRKLALIEDGQVVKVYRIAVGAPGTPTPEGEFQIINRITDPTWYGGKKPVPAGPDNPLGTRWMGLNKKGYGIHGTNVPRSIGKRASHGCIRMAQADLEELFEIVRIGDVVVLEGQRTAEVAAVFGVPQVPAGKTVIAAATAGPVAMP